MELSAHILINRPVELVWNQIIDIRNSAQFIEGIIKIEVLEEPENTLIGFKWKETRMMFGKERSEEHTSELQSRPHLVCRLLLEKKKKKKKKIKNKKK